MDIPWRFVFLSCVVFVPVAALAIRLAPKRLPAALGAPLGTGTVVAAFLAIGIGLSWAIDWYAYLDSESEIRLQGKPTLNCQPGFHEHVTSQRAPGGDENVELECTEDSKRPAPLW